jgi:hypothetical protein
MQMEQNRINSLQQMGQGLQNAAAIYAQTAHTEYHPITVPAMPQMDVNPPGSMGNPIYVAPQGGYLIPTSH